jgi:seryl-tRNA synthetase
VPPATVKELALVGSGHFPGERQEVYELHEHSDKETEAKYLAGTSEPSLLTYRADEVIDEKELPLKYSGLSACYRREVGGYGKDTKGLYRVHEFSKVEQVVICRNDLDESLKLFEEIKNNALEILTELELPHRVVQISTGDMGAGKYKMYDIETWMPSRNSYGETHSNSHLTDWQARRLNIRYKDKSGKLVYPHTMNNTAIASPRILIAMMENHQHSDGSIKIPKVLHKYLDFKQILP